MLTPVTLATRNILATRNNFATRVTWALPCLLALSLPLCAPELRAQGEAPPQDRPRTSEPVRRTDTNPEQVFYLRNGTAPNDANEVLTAARLMLDPSVKLYLDGDQNAILARGLPDQLALLSKIIEQLDRPKPSFRLNYTVTESDAGRKLGVQHFSVLVILGGRTTLKNGSKVPVATGTAPAGPGSSDRETQFSYLDVGLNIDASLDAVGSGARLRTKIEQSSAAEQTTIAGVTEPVIRQTVLEQTALLEIGKPVVLGAVDVTGSTRHLEIEVVLEPMR